METTRFTTQTECKKRAKQAKRLINVTSECRHIGTGVCMCVWVKVRIKRYIYTHIYRHSNQVKQLLQNRLCVYVCESNDFFFGIQLLHILCVCAVLHSVTLFIRCKQLRIHSSPIRTVLYTSAKIKVQFLVNCLKERHTSITHVSGCSKSMQSN